MQLVKSLFLLEQKKLSMPISFLEILIVICGKEILPIPISLKFKWLF